MSAVAFNQRVSLFPLSSSPLPLSQPPPFSPSCPPPSRLRSPKPVLRPTAKLGFAGHNADWTNNGSVDSGTLLDRLKGIPSFPPLSVACRAVATPSGSLRQAARIHWAPSAATATSWPMCVGCQRNWKDEAFASDSCVSPLPFSRSPSVEQNWQPCAPKRAA